MELIEIEQRVAELHRIYSEELKNRSTNVIDPVSGRYKPLPKYENLRLKPDEIPFAELQKSPLRKFVECSLCGFDINLCTHNPFIMTAEKWQKKLSDEMKARKAMEAQLQAEDPTNEYKVISLSPVSSGSRGRKKTTLPVSPEILAQCIAKYNSGESNGMVALAKEFNVAPPELSEKMKAAGCIIRRGRK
jgi:hypothetical protein